MHAIYSSTERRQLVLTQIHACGQASPSGCLEQPDEHQSKNVRLLATGDGGPQKHEPLLHHKADPRKASSHQAHDVVRLVAVFKEITDSSGICA